MAHSYLKKLFTVILLVVLVPALLNMLADPYGIWNVPVLKGVNDAKFVGFHTRIPAYVGWARWTQAPETVLLGTSRMAGGVRVNYPAFNNSTTYNMALGGQPIHETLVLFKHALKAGKLKRVVIGLDFFAFNAYWSRGVVDERRLTTGFNFDLLFNTSTLTDSLTTVRQSLANTRIVTNANAQDNSFVSNPSALPIRQQFIGVEQLFVSYHRPAPYQMFSYSVSDENTLDDFRELLKIAYANHIKLHMFISPAHAWHWEGLINISLLNKWEEWKRELVRINREEAENSHQATASIWDFSGYNSITTEPVPAEGITTPMRWYSDSSHYNQACGELILDRLFASAGAVFVPADFGTIINEKNIEQHLSRIRQDRELYVETHPVDVAVMSELSKRMWKF